MAEVQKYYSIPVVVWELAHAEYMHPANHTMQIRLTNNTWMVLDRWKDHEYFKAVKEFAENSSNDFKIKEFGWRQKEDEARFRAIAKEEALKAVEAEKAVAAKQRAEVEESKAPELPPPAPPEVPKVEEPKVAFGAVTTETVVVLNSKSEEAPTVAVTVPATVTPVMELQVTNIAPEISNTSIDPQIEMKLVPTDAVSNEAILATVETPAAETANVVIAVQPEMAAVMDEALLNIPATVSNAIEVAAPAIPPKAEEVQTVPVVAAVNMEVPAPAIDNIVPEVPELKP